jgi:enoyl-CoA hydratase/carnithine racemase
LPDELTTAKLRPMSITPVPSGDVTVSVDGPIVTATFSRPEKRNALTQAMYHTVADTLEAADADLGISVVVLTGSGVAFTAGNDLADFASGASLDGVQHFLDAISTVKVAVVAAVNGIAVGVGLTMLLHCDLVYVEPDAVFSVPFVSLGLVPEAGSSLLLPRVIGERRASDLLLTGRRITGAEAAEWGLANAAVSPVLDVALEAARRLSLQPPLALRATKALLRSDDTTVAGRMMQEMSCFADALIGPEFSEANAARTEKRDPVFRR